MNFNGYLQVTTVRTAHQESPALSDHPASAVVPEHQERRARPRRESCARDHPETRVCPVPSVPMACLVCLVAMVFPVLKVIADGPVCRVRVARVDIQDPKDRWARRVLPANPAYVCVRMLTAFY